LEPAALVQTEEEGVGGIVLELQPVTVHSQKASRDGDGNALVPIHEGMILGEAFPQGGRLLNQVLVVAAPRACQRRFQSPQVTEAR
jgi:hypothetical protein